ncbi:MAG: hypothetical protein AAF063_00730 [Cyanobacteria bacterium J06643_5]
MDAIKICQEINDLLKESEYFTFENFSSERVRNLPAKLSPKWVSWQNRAVNLITTYLPKDSNPHILLKEGIEICLIGAKQEKFKTVKNYINQALSEALEIINLNGTKILLTTIDSSILNENKKEIKTQYSPSTPKIIISHTPEQEKLVEALVSVFESALNVNVGDIRCTSLSGYSFPIGINVTSLLHTEIKQAEIVIGIMTLDKAQSNVLFELGAAWGFQKSIFIVLANGVATNYLPSPLQELNSIILTDIRKCHELVDRIVEETTLEKKENVNAIIAGAIQKLAEVSRENYDIELQRKNNSNQTGQSIKVKILILAAIPHRLRLDKEIRFIFECIRGAARRDMFEVDIRIAVRSQDIRIAIREEKPQIVHFCGHGEDDGSLVLEDDGGNDKSVLPQGLAALFEQHSDYVKCVVFNACYSVKTADAVSQHINYVIGMNRAIGDKAAIAFTQGFYDGLGYEQEDNQDVFQKAFNEGLVAIGLEDFSQKSIPVLKKKL